MTRPGERLRAIAARRCSERTMERLIDPLLADLQTEYDAAMRHGRVWRGRWVRIAGYVAFLKVIVMCGWAQSIRALRDWPVDDRRAVGRTIALSASAIVLLTLAMEVPGFLSLRGWAHAQDLHLRFLAYMIPQALPIALPMGLTFGILRGLGSGVVSRRSTCAVLALAAIGSVASFVLLASIVPAASHAWRDAYLGHEAANFMKSPSQMTLGELSQQIDAYKSTAMAGSSVARDMSFTYHSRWALSCATLVLAVFALTVSRRRRAGWLMSFIPPFGVCFGYYAVLFYGRNAGLQGTLPIFTAAWLPNMVFGGLAAMLLKVASPRPTDRLVS